MEPTDPQLIRAAADGDPTAYARFVRRHGAAVLRYCLSRLDGRHAAEDATQETMLRMLEQVQAGRVPDAPTAWLFAVARNCCNEQRRQRKRHDASPLSAELPAETPPPAVEVADLLERLSDTERSLIYLKHTEGLKCREIAERTGKPLGTVTAALARAYAKLRGELGGQERRR